jgi:hypothetical protein
MTALPNSDKKLWADIFSASKVIVSMWERDSPVNIKFANEHFYSTIGSRDCKVFDDLFGKATSEMTTQTLKSSIW